jgi:hypothetical protein
LLLATIALFSVAAFDWRRAPSAATA